MEIQISQIKKWREEIDASHIIVLAIGKDGVQNVATHGETEHNAKEAAYFGNQLKKELGFPEELCISQPLERICKNCTFYKPDRGYHCFNGWSGDGSSGTCMCRPRQRVTTNAEDKCHMFEPKC